MTESQLQSIQLADDLGPDQRTEILKFFSNFADIFTWDEVDLSDLGCLTGPWQRPGDPKVFNFCKWNQPHTFRLYSCKSIFTWEIIITKKLHTQIKYLHMYKTVKSKEIKFYDFTMPSTISL
jgi:hypothetical protein